MSASRCRTVGAADVRAQSFVGQPEVLTPDDALFDVGWQSVEKHLFADGHLRHAP